MRLKRIQEYLRSEGYPYSYWETDGCGTIEFDHRGLHYHIWEYPESECGAEANLASAGRSVEYTGDYETELLKILKSWKGSW